MRYVKLEDFLTTAELIQCMRMWKESQDRYAKRVCAEIIEPNMERINKSLGQENDAMYLAYAVEFVMGKASQ